MNTKIYKMIENATNKSYTIDMEEDEYGIYVDGHVTYNNGNTKRDLIVNLTDCPEDATWDRDLSNNFYTGIDVGIASVLNTLKQNPQLLEELINEV
jgi:hypothetical protein